MRVSMLLAVWEFGVNPVIERGDEIVNGNGGLDKIPEGSAIAT
jgi:hypothetical protein